MATNEDLAEMLRRGTLARRAGRFSEALQSMNEAAALCGPDQDYDRAHVLRELGELARNQHDPDTAQVQYEQAVALLRNSDDRLKLAHTIRHLGDIHAGRHHWYQADRCFVEALEIYRSHPSPGLLDFANAIRAYAALKAEIGQRNEARALWAEARELYEAEGIAAGVEECSRRLDK